MLHFVHSEQVRVDMGEPILKAADVPTTLAHTQARAGAPGLHSAILPLPWRSCRRRRCLVDRWLWANAGLSGLPRVAG